MPPSYICDGLYNSEGCHLNFRLMSYKNVVIIWLVFVTFNMKFGGIDGIIPKGSGICRCGSSFT